MPTNDQDARALTYLARRLRDETHGAPTWDETGTWTVIAKLIGQNLATTVERVTRHAADPAAKTPGAITRPFVPDAQPAKWEPSRGPWCGICGKPVDGHPDSDHQAEVAPDRKRRPDAIHQIVEHAKGELQATRPRPVPAVHTTNPDGPAARARAAAATDAEETE